MTMTAGGAGYAGSLYRKRVLLEIEHAGALRAGRAREALLWWRRQGDGIHTGDAFDDMPYGPGPWSSMPASAEFGTSPRRWPSSRRRDAGPHAAYSRGAASHSRGPFGRKIKDQPNGAVVTPVRRARLAVGSHEAPSSPASACSSAMRVSSTRDVMSSLRNTWRRWNATVCVLMNS
jgi:hypothetical protein